MSDHLIDTPSVARMYCPGCEPAADPGAEILDVRWCEAHKPAERGSADDAVVSANVWISGSIEAGGDDNRRFCDFLHRRAS